MNQRSVIGRSALLLTWSVFLTAITGVLGGAPLKIFRNQAGAIFFWLAGFVLCGGFWFAGWYALAIGFALLVILVGLLVEAEELGLNVVGSALMGIIGASVFAGGAVFIWAARTGPTWQAQVIEHVSAAFSRLNTPEFQQMSQNIKPDELLSQFPSILISLLVIVVALTLILERPFARWTGGKVARRDKLTAFRAPDAFIWMFILGLLFGFADFGVQGLNAMGVNILNICLVIYFFQGLAVLCRYFELFRVGYFWRTLWIAVFAVQLFVILSLVGLVDYWLDFRRVLSRRAAGTKKHTVSKQE